jgi:predicted ATPase
MPNSIEHTFAANVQTACNRAAARVVHLARQTGTPVIIWDHETGQVRAISPDEAEERLAISSTPGHSAQPDRSSD